MGPDVDPGTMWDTIHETLNIKKRVACQKDELNQELKEYWVKWATIMKQRYPKQDKWKHVQFSDEMHSGYGPQGKDLILRNSQRKITLKQRHCPNTSAPLGPSMALGLSLTPAFRCLLVLTNPPLAQDSCAYARVFRRSFLFCGTLCSCLLKVLIAHHLHLSQNHWSGWSANFGFVVGQESILILKEGLFRKWYFGGTYELLYVPLYAICIWLIKLLFNQIMQRRKSLYCHRRYRGHRHLQYLVWRIWQDFITFWNCKFSSGLQCMSEYSLWIERKQTSHGPSSRHISLDQRPFPCRLV